MKSIIMIVPYFGKMNNYFNLWLKSCEYNSSIEWLIITDDQSDYNYPKNVNVVYMEFKDLISKIKDKYKNIDVNLSEPYRLCDYRPAYGDIFNEYIREYDFWGHCDLDVIFGDIRYFITNDILEKHDKILKHGHFTLYKNTTEINLLYKNKFLNREIYKEVFETDASCFFDEILINKIFDNENKSIYDKITFADLMVKRYNFKLNHFGEDEVEKSKNNIFIWENGKIYRQYIKNDKLKRKEYMYIHFLRRPMQNNIYEYQNLDRFIIKPNEFCDYNTEINMYNYVKRNGKNKIYLNYYSRRLRPSYINKKIKGDIKFKKANIVERFINV